MHVKNGVRAAVNCFFLCRGGDQSGFPASGDILLSWDGEPIDSSQMFGRKLARQRPGDVCRWQVLRDATLFTFEVRVGAQVWLGGPRHARVAVPRFVDAIGRVLILSLPFLHHGAVSFAPQH